MVRLRHLWRLFMGVASLAVDRHGDIACHDPEGIMQELAHRRLIAASERHVGRLMRRTAYIGMAPDPFRCKEQML